MSKKQTTAATTLEKQLQMSLKDVLSMSKDVADQIQLENKVLDAQFKSEAGLVSLRETLSKKERDLSSLERSTSNVANQILENRLSGYDFQKEVTLYTQAKANELSIEDAKETVAFHKGLLAHMEAVHAQLFG